MVRVRVRSRVPVPADLWGDMLAAQRLCLAQGMHCARLAELSSLQLMPADAGRWDACTELECLEAGATFAAHGGGQQGTCRLVCAGESHVCLSPCFPGAAYCTRAFGARFGRAILVRRRHELLARLHCY